MIEYRYLLAKDWKMEEEMENNVEREIDLMDLIWCVLKKWRLLMAWALIGTILLGGYSYWKSAQVTRSVEDRAELVSSMDSQDVRTVTEAVNLYRQSVTLEEDIENDPILSMNPYEMAQVTLLFYIDVENITDGNGAVLRTYNEDLQVAYQSKVLSDENRTALAGLMQVSPGQISSYVKVEASGTSSLKVTLISDQESVCNNMADYVEETLSNYSDELRQQIGAHELSLISRNTEIGYVSDIDTQRTNRTKSLTTLQDNLDAKVSGLTTAQWALYNYDVARIKEGGELSDPSVSIKYLVLGLLAGGFLACVYVALAYILSGKVKTEEELKQLLGMKYVGMIEEDGKKGLFGAVDRWLHRLQYGKGQLKKEQQLKIAAANISLLCAKKDNRQLYITGTGIQVPADGSLAQLTELLEKDGIAVSVGGSVLTDADALEEMAKTGQVLLWETIGRSGYEKVRRLITLCKMQNVDVLGAVAVR